MMNGRRSHAIILSILILIFQGCVHAISRQNRESALKDLTPDLILQDFEAYRGRLALMGGEIIQTQNLEEETLIEVLQKPLSRSTDRPLTGREGDGRFLVRYQIFKDPYVFSEGREITVAGIVAGKKVSKIGEKAYTYVILQDRETHLWPERTDYYEYYPYPYPYYPYGYPYYPWGHPWHHYPYHRH